MPVRERVFVIVTTNLEGVTLHGPETGINSTVTVVPWEIW